MGYLLVYTIGSLLVMMFLSALLKVIPTKSKGDIWERQVNKLLSNLGEDYTLYKDIYVEKKDGNMTQIDHVVVSKYGIFVLETKNFSGWIFGNEKQRNWTQTIYRKKSRFYNPILQNKTHMKALDQYLQYNRPMHSIIVFSNAVTFKFEEVFNDVTVLKMRQLVKIIENYTERELTDKQVEILNKRMSQLDIKDRKKKVEVKKDHIAHVKEVQATGEKK